jgi:NADH-quinone oxidoreductase subunit N
MGQIDDAQMPLMKLGLALILIGLGFSCYRPFQVWTPDVYEGAPTLSARFSPLAPNRSLAMLLRIFATVPSATQYWFWAFWILAALTMFAGNLGALVQTNVKRLLAYSSIAHAGYILVAFAAVTGMTSSDTSTVFGGVPAYAAVLFYLLSYALVKVGAFTIVSQLGGKDESTSRSKTTPPLATPSNRGRRAAFSFLSWVCRHRRLPRQILYFQSRRKPDLIWLAVLMAVNSIIGAYYYLKVIVAMYVREPAKTPPPQRPSPSPPPSTLFWPSPPLAPSTSASSPTKSSACSWKKR